MSETATPISLAAYGRHRGVSVEAVSKAIRAGRLRESLVLVGGRPKIADLELADREWQENTRPHAGAGAASLLADRAPDLAIEAVPDYATSRALREAAAARREAALADLAELDVAERTGAVVPVDKARADLIDRYAIARTKLLGVPSRVGQRFPRLGADVLAVIEELVREALEDLAVEDDEGNGSELERGDDDEE